LIANGEIITNHKVINNDSKMTSDSDNDSDSANAININNKKRTPENKIDDLPSNTSNNISKNSGKRMMKGHNNKTENNKNHKIVIIGDSHARGLAKEVRNHLKKNFEINGLVKPGAGAEILANSAMSEMVNLTKSDVIVFCGGSNDVSKNNANMALKHILSFVKANNNTNIILLSAPHRHDLMESSCVNNEIRSFNRKLRKYVKPIDRTTVVETNPNREFYTLHGLHLNGRGKGKVAKQIAAQLASIPGKKVEGPISPPLVLGWLYDSAMNNDILVVDTSIEAAVVQSKNNHMSQDDNNLVHDVNQDEIPSRNSKRNRKIPVTRTQDFLWQI
jgi:lysophospholipase L1-like esterase